MKLQMKLMSIFITFISIFHNTFGASQSLSACFNSTQKSLNIHCGYGNMVRIIRTFYGYAEKVNGHARCHYQNGDCILEERDTYPCVGRDSCNINLPTGGYGQRISNSQCDIESNYFQVDYECVPATNNHNICNKQELTEEWGYISTPNYPNYYNSSKTCEVKIKVKPGQKIKPYIIDMDLESQGSNCPDWFYSHDNYHSVTLCGKRSNEDLPSSMGNELYIQFVSNADVNRKGFWLYYEAFPPTTTTTTTTTTTMTTRKRIEWQKSSQNNKISNTQQAQPATNVPVTKITKHINISQKDQIPFAAIVGGVIGTLSIILVVLLALLAVKWWKERRRKCDKNRFIEVQNPGYRNSNEFRSSGADMCYNYIDC